MDSRLRVCLVLTLMVLAAGCVSVPRSVTAVEAANAAFAEARARYDRGDYPGAIVSFDEALELVPDMTDALIERSWARYDLGEYAAAIEDLTAAMAVTPEDRALLARRGECYWRLQQYDPAVEDLQRAVDLGSTDPWAFAYLGDSKRLLDRHAGALPDLTAALGLVPDNPWILARRGENHRMLGLFPEAIADLSRAIELDAQDSFSYASRGQAYRQAGELNLALADLDRALTIAPDYPWAADRRKELLEELGTSRRTGELPLIAVLDFTAENFPASEARLIVEVVASALVNTGSYRVLERGRQEALLKEIELSAGEAMDVRQQLKVGKLLSADQIVVGTLGRVGQRHVLSAKLLKVETGEVLTSVHRVYTSLEAMVDGAEDIGFLLADL